MEEVDTSPFLNDKEVKIIQRIVGTFLYYARGVNNTTHPALNDIESNQTKSTEHTKIATNMLMD